MVSREIQEPKLISFWKGSRSFQPSMRSSAGRCIHCPLGGDLCVHIEWDMVVVTVFLSILNRMKFHSDQNRKKICHHDHIPFNVKGNVNIVSSGYLQYYVITCFLRYNGGYKSYRLSNLSLQLCTILYIEANRGLSGFLISKRFIKDIILILVCLTRVFR